MKQTTLIRNARLDDASALAGLFGEMGFSSSADEMRRRMRAMPSSEVALVADSNGLVLGVATVHVTQVFHRPAPIGRITALVVTEAARGQGIGRLLVEAAERYFVERDCGMIELTSNFKLTEAHAFYRKLGFESTGYRFKKALGR